MEDLLRQREELQNQIRELDELSTTGTEKILQAIKNQRWFFFKNNKYILMDRNTARLWLKDSNISNTEKINSEGLGGFSDWKREHLSLSEALLKPVMPVKSDVYTDALVPDNYENNILPSNNFYTETEKLQFTLDIFVKNDLIPLFDDAEATQLYRKIFVEKSALIKQLAEVETQLAELQAAQIKLTANFDYRQLLAHYDTAAVDRSAIKYFDAATGVADELLEALNEYEAAQATTIAECLKIALKLKAKYTDNPNLTPEENSLLAERQKFLAQRLELGTDAPKKKILSVKVQAEKFFARLETINSGKNSIRELAALQTEPRPSFELLVENLARIILDTQRKVDFFVAHKNFVAGVVNANAGWSDDYKAFKTSLREELFAACRDESIDEEIFSAWYDDWQKKRFALEQRFLPLVKFGLKGNLIDAAEKIFKVLREYREAVDKFYLHERKNIYQKFAFTAGGDLQEKFETESELYKLAEKFQRDLQEIIFSREKTEERIFLLRWAEPLLNLSIDEISDFIRDRELDAISEEVLTSFAELRRQNFEKYLADSKSFGEAVQQREKEYNALIFRMRKDLHKS
ncbi:MAG: hypothetical protein IJR52_00550 [Selenomonadaceae bacterium]|nr:hypothetical protein [Selenomonadaceae bacterium]MBQ9496043.1 hypothetical protein [Selenomonadaceae bacterium]